MTGQHPGLRSHSRKRKSGKVVTYYFFDRRQHGLPDIPLGTDFDQAIKRWEEIRTHGHLQTDAGLLEEAFRLWERDAERGLPSYEKRETRRGYEKNLRRLRPVFGTAAWHDVTMPTLVAYLDARSAKTQGNREMSLLSIVWNYARTKGLTDLPWPAAGMERSKWRNKEKPRKKHVLAEAWDAIWHEGDQVLRDVMDLGSATGMRLTDCIEVLLPRGDMLRLEASKTGKEAEWDLSLSALLPDLLARRRAMQANHLMLLSRPDGKPVRMSQLRHRWDQARARAACKAIIHGDDDLAREIRAMWLRDARKLAAQTAPDLKAAAALLQHGDERLTERHYGGVRRLKPVR